MQRSWQVSAAGRVAGVCGLVVFGIFSIAAAVISVGTEIEDPYSAGERAGIAAAAAAVVALCTWLALRCLAMGVRPSISLTDEKLIIRNPSTTHQIERSAISDVLPGYGGIAITCADGTVVNAWAVQKSNLSHWTGRNTRADAVAEEIRAAVTVAAGRPPERPTAERGR